MIVHSADIPKQSTPFITPTKCTVLINKIWKEQLQNVSIKVYHLQGEQNAGFKILSGTLVGKYVGDSPIIYLYYLRLCV